MNLIEKNILGLIILVFCFTTEAGTWPQIPVPKNEHIIIISDNMIVNGLPVKSMELTSRKSVTDILNFYKKKWKKAVKKGAPGYIVNEVKPYKIISRLENGYLMTVQVKRNGMRGSYSLLAISQLPKKNEIIKSLGAGFPKMNTTTVLSDIQTVDIGQKGRTLIMENSFSLQSNINYYRDYFLKRGWVEVGGKALVNKKLGASVMMMNKSNNELNITFNRHKKKTHIVAVKVDK